MAPLSMHCVPPSKRHALYNANGHSWGFAAQRCPSPVPRRSDLCAYLRPASNNPVTNNNANASFLDMLRAHTRIRISTPHVGVLITFIGACAPPFRQRKRTATNQRLSAVRRCKPLRGPGIAMSGTTPNSAPRRPYRLGSKPRQLQRPSPQHQPRPAQQPAAAPADKRAEQAIEGRI